MHFFDITINDDWKSADVWGIGWVNGSEAAEVRKDIDELMSQIPGNDATNPLTPSAQGNDGKYSTDERCSRRYRFFLCRKDNCKVWIK